MRSSDWSSDVCSSDLQPRFQDGEGRQALRLCGVGGCRRRQGPGRLWPWQGARGSRGDLQGDSFCKEGDGSHSAARRDRKSVVSGKSVSVRVDLGGRRIVKKTNKQEMTRTQITK